MKNTSYYTKEVLDNLLDSLNNLITKERKKISNLISEARQKGDLSENAEYDAAKVAQSLLELKIFKLKSKLANVKVILKSEINLNKVSLFTKIKVLNRSNNKKFIYHIVSED